jgi:sulfopyruvate decarboxylase TPP-binding subunit
VEDSLAQNLVDGLSKAGVNFITYLPESRLSQILPLLRNSPSFQLVPVSNESEAIGISAGAALGGKQAACYMEGSGLYVACYSLLMVAKRFGIPLLLITAYHSSFSDQKNNFFYALPGAEEDDYERTLFITPADDGHFVVFVSRNHRRKKK